ncbi:MAG: B12-binding domain-containing radical SAM protein [Proteobacteria bacterium]|nr:B12-binding domain-containing radical SAM protein [Pseudomonadota bacterium]
MKVLFVYPHFQRHAEAHPELLDSVPMTEYLGSPSLGIAAIAALTPPEWEVEFRDDRLSPADVPTDADIVALSFFTGAAKRGLALADYFRSNGKTVVAGGIFPTMMPDVTAPHVDAVVIGEGEGSWLRLLDDYKKGELKPQYRCLDTVDLANLPIPDLSLYFGLENDRFKPDDYPLQISRGCPMNCRACVLPVSMTKELRCFKFDHVLGQLDQLAKADKMGCLTEDTSWFPASAQKKLMEAMFDHMLAEGVRAKISYIGISMPMILCTSPKFLAKAKACGVDLFYLVGGFDPITMGAFSGDNDRALQRAHKSIKKAWDAGIEPYTSFLIGGDQDDVGTADRMLEFAEKAKIRKAEFAIATPYPGTPQWHQLVEEKRILTKDWSKYNDANVVFRPAQMTPDQLLQAYLDLWRGFYADKKHLADLPTYQQTIQF